jgi:hypothetical protein
MDHYSSYPTSLLAKNRRLGLRILVGCTGTGMHRTVGAHAHAGTARTVSYVN